MNPGRETIGAAVELMFLGFALLPLTHTSHEEEFDVEVQ